MLRGLLFLLLSCSSLSAVDLIVFSYDRPMQLFACLESIERYLTGLDQIHVIYRTSAASYETGYRKVAARFPKAHFHPQSKSAQADFKPLLLTAFNSGSSPYILFSVDDIIVTDFVNLEECTNALESQAAWGFYLRLGKNITHFYMGNTASPVPSHQDIVPNMMLWTFRDGTGDWRYPNTVDMTIYRKRDICAFVTAAAYTNPNSFESAWLLWSHLQGKGVAFHESKVVNIPLNLVNLSANRHANLYTPKALLKKFERGYTIDIGALHKIPHKSVHMDYTPRFVKAS